MLELAVTGEGSFVTLTYDDAHLPEDLSVSKEELQRWLKRVRKVASVRYFAVGEYGSRTHRPHYHAVLFGLGPESATGVVSKTWRMGLSHVGSVTLRSVGYVAGYVAKRWTRKVPAVVADRACEFSLMSRHPGIGAVGLERIVAWLHSEQGAVYVARNHDVPQAIRLEGKLYPLGRYLVERLRREVDLPESSPARDVLREERFALELADPLRERRRQAYYERRKVMLDRSLQRRSVNGAS